MKNFTLRKITLCALLTAFALISFILESLFPPLILPGARMGISNVFILLSALILGSVYGYATLIIKVTLGSIFSGNVSALLYSLPAGLISLTLELLLIVWTKKVSVLAGSIAGATLNITVQNLVFCIITGYIEFLYYLPYLAVIGAVGGCIVGFIVHLIFKKVNLSFLSRYINFERENNFEQEKRS